MNYERLITTFANLAIRFMNEGNDRTKADRPTLDAQKVQERFKGYAEALSALGLVGTPYAVELDVREAWATTVMDCGSFPSMTSSKRASWRLHFTELLLTKYRPADEGPTAYKAGDTMPSRNGEPGYFCSACALHDGDGFHPHSSPPCDPILKRVW